jgi:DNA-binding transcriptional LysR family regulator
MDKFLEMQTFVTVVDAGSFVGATDVLSMSKPAVSRHVNELESRLGVRLLHRTTRRLALTDEGGVFYARCKELLAALDEAESEITMRSGEASGLVRVNAPLSFGMLHLASLWSEFKASHPKVTLDVTLGDRTVDLIEEGYDLAIRIARLPSSTLVSRRLASTRMVLCASPQYLKKSGKPRDPSDLAEHSILAYSYWSSRDEWEFNGPDGTISVNTTPRLRTNNGDTCRIGALNHQGIILQPTFLIGEDIKAGRLVELLPQFKCATLDIYAVYPTRKFVSPKVRLLIDFLVNALKKPDWDI